jgi:hypothetical protein
VGAAPLFHLRLIFDQIIVTSYLFPEAKFSRERLEAISKAVGKDKLVVDVRYAGSCVFFPR